MLLLAAQQAEAAAIAAQQAEAAAAAQQAAAAPEPESFNAYESELEPEYTLGGQQVSKISWSAEFWFAQFRNDENYFHWKNSALS